MILKIVNVLLFITVFTVVYIAIYKMIEPKTTYKNQIGLHTVCDEYLFYKKADVPIACYEYFGIK